MEWKYVENIYLRRYNVNMAVILWIIYIFVPSITSTHLRRTLGIPFQFNDASDATEQGDSSWELGYDPGFTGVSPENEGLEVVEHTDAFLFPSTLSCMYPELDADDPLPSPDPFGIEYIRISYI